MWHYSPFVPVLTHFSKWSTLCTNALRSRSSKLSPFPCRVFVLLFWCVSSCVHLYIPVYYYSICALFFGGQALYECAGEYAVCLAGHLHVVCARACATSRYSIMTLYSSGKGFILAASIRIVLYVMLPAPSGGLRESCRTECGARHATPNICFH